MESKISKLKKDKPLQNILVLGMDKKERGLFQYLHNVFEWREYIKSWAPLKTFKYLVILKMVRY